MSRVTEGPTVAAPYLDGLVGAVPQVSVGKVVAAVDLCAMLGEAIDATGSRKEAAIHMGISGPVLSKQLGRVEDAAEDVRDGSHSHASASLIRCRSTLPLAV